MTKKAFSFEKGSKPYRFLKLFPPDKNGKHADYIPVAKLPSDLQFGNGRDWARDGSRFAQTFIVDLDKKNGKENGKILGVKLNGFNEDENTSQQIATWIKNDVSKRPCVILGTTSRVEVDHKAGLKNDLRVMGDVKTQRLDDFQPLSKTANVVKRQRCRECKKTRKRFDATTLGYPISVLWGGLELDEMISRGADPCGGCYWNDPMEFKSCLAVNRDAVGRLKEAKNV